MSSIMGLEKRVDYSLLFGESVLEGMMVEMNFKY